MYEGERCAFAARLREGNGVQHILDTASQALGNPIVLIDICYNLLANTETTVTDDPLWNELTQQGKFSHKTVDFFNTESFIEEVAVNDVVAVLRSRHLKYDRVCGKFFDSDGLQLGCIIVVACCRPLETLDLALIETTCEAIAEALQNSDLYPGLEHVIRKSFDNLLVESDSPAAVPLPKNVTELRKGLKPYLYIAVVDVTQYEHTLSHLTYLRSLFEQMDPSHRFFINLNNIVILGDSEFSQIDIRRDFAELCDFFTTYHIYAGISSTFQELLELRQYYRQALNALNYGLVRNSGRHFHLYDDCRADCFLSAAASVVETAGYCHPIALEIEEHDHKNSSGYGRFFCAYMQCGCDMAATAAKLRLSPGDAGRLRREMQTRFGLDWRNGEQLFSVYLSMKLLPLSQPDP